MSNEGKLFPLEKITSMSAGDYCDSKRKKLSDYEIVPVHVRIDSFRGLCPDIRTELAKSVQQNAEMVTDYQLQIAMNDLRVLQYAAGNALIPKEKEESDL